MGPIPCTDTSTNTERLVLHNLVGTISIGWERLACNLTSVTGVVTPIRHSTQNETFGQGYRLTHRTRFKRRKFVQVGFEEVGELHHDGGTLLAWNLSPFRKGCLGCADGCVDICF